MQRAKVAMKVFRSLVTNPAAIWRGVFSTATGGKFHYKGDQADFNDIDDMFFDLLSQPWL